MNKLANELELSVRAHAVLNRLGIETLDGFLAIQEREVLALTNAGRRTWREIKDTQDHIHWARSGGSDWQRLKTLLHQANAILQARPAFRVALEAGRLVPIATQPGGSDAT